MLDITVIAVVLIFVYAVLGYLKPGVALVTVPFVAVALGYAALIGDKPETLLLAPVLVLVTLVVIAVSNRDPESRQWSHRWASGILIALALILLVTTFFAVFEAIGAGAILPLLFLLGIVAIISSVVAYGASSRKTVAVQVVSTLAGSMKQNLPLPMALDCAASGRDDATARTFRNIKKWLVQGLPLAESIRRGYPQCPSRTLAMLTVGERLGQLPAAFDAIRTNMRARALERGKLRPVHPLYPLVILTIMFFLLLAVIRFVMPTLKAVLEETTQGMLPRPTRILVGVVNFLVYDTHLWLLLALVPLGILLLWLRGRYSRRRPEELNLLSQIGDFLKWHVPILHWFERNYSMLEVVELLRLSLSAGCPVNEAIAGTLELDVNVCFRKRLRCWRDRVEGGDSVSDAARDCGLGTALAWAFDPSVGTADAPVMLEMLESFYRSNYSYRVNLARFILWPCAIIALGVTVGFVILAIFLPGITVITEMAASAYP